MIINIYFTEQSSQVAHIPYYYAGALQEQQRNDTTKIKLKIQESKQYIKNDTRRSKVEMPTLKRQNRIVQFLAAF